MTPSKTRVAVLYPWSGLPALDRGAARRVVPMVEVLAQHFREVTVLCPGEKSCPEHVGNIRYIFHHPTPTEKALVQFAHRIYDGFTYHALRGRVDIRERRQWWFFLQPFLQLSLQRQIRHVAENADVLILEYPFWSGILHRVMDKHPKPVVLTLDDLLSNIVSPPWLKARVRENERAACCRAQAIVCVSRSEQEEIQAAGFTTEFVPHGLDLSRTEVESSPSDFPTLGPVLAARKSGAMVCLFVGSSLQPNRDAVEAIKHMAAQLREEQGIFFVVAGACCGAMTLAENVISLGAISEEILHHLYALSDVALAPIASGSGASLKVLEALARQKVLVSTTVGVRSHGLENGREAILCDDLAEYPALLQGLKNDPQMRARLAAAGWKFVQAFDCRTVYQTYVNLVTKLSPHS